MKSKDLADADAIGITVANLSILKTGKAKAVRFSTLAAICKELDCQPEDILEYRAEGQWAVGSITVDRLQTAYC